MRFEIASIDCYSPVLGIFSAAETDCIPGDFKCANKQCIDGKFACDHQADCDDGSDEIHCGKSAAAFPS